MDIYDQSAVIAFLKKAESYGFDGAVKVIETHISLVFLIDGRAYKLKRAVKLPYVDFSTLDMRHGYCLREVELNGRATPELYLGVRTITRDENGELAFDGKGEAVDVVVEMNRFAQHDLFDRMATEGKLTPALMEATARMVSEFHATAPVVHGGSGSANMAGVLDINEGGFATSHVFAKDRVEGLTALFRAAWKTHVGSMDRRESAGKVRLCHGDLHLRNIFLSSGGPRLFDCIDFNDQIATVDVLYDLAFLLMDLWHRDLAGFANIVVNRYLDVTGDDDGFALLPFFMAVRAAVRAHVTATQIEEGAGATDALAATAQSYFDFADELLVPQKPRLIAIGGLSGSGKSSVAERLGSLVGGPPGARLFESDRIRKAMYSIATDERLPLDAYLPDVSKRVYTSLCDKAAGILAGGGTVVVNAVFDRQQDRDQIEAVARALGVPFTGLWLDVRREILFERVRERPQGPSDATVEVLEKQLRKDLGSMRWQRIDGAAALDAVVAQAARLAAA